MKTIRWQLVMEGEGDYAKPFRDAAQVAADLVKRGIAAMDRECFTVILLDTKNRPIAGENVSIGILNGSLIHPREVFKAAVGIGAASILIAHNHPSGDVTPSAEDCEVTRRLRAAGGILGISVLDHIIVEPGGAFYSFREEGRMD